jgi:hypothetical protein
MKKLLLLTTFLGLLTTSGFSQLNRFWSVNNESRSSIIADKSTLRQSFPKEVKLFNLNFDLFKKVLFSVVDRNASKTSTVISLPNAEGNTEDFEVFEASNFEPALQARFPEIRAYSGRGITDKSATLKLSISPQGVQTMVFRTGKANEFMAPYSKDRKVYAVYSSHRAKGQLPWSCSTEEDMAFALGEKVKNTTVVARSGGNLKTMRLAQSVTAEYSNYFGATGSGQVSLVLAAINNTLTRCNGVYEKDLALHLNLISASTNVIYYNASTDPYSPASSGAGGAWNSELQNTLTSVIGEANYDVGHLFGASGGGGNAGCIGCICTNGSKGSGYTSPADAIPEGDNFDIDYVVHEIGHQLGANHTFSMSNEGTGVNKEVGSGITIMGYAGITSQDVAPHSIDMYHQASIAQIQTNLGSKTCPVTTTISNATPVVAALTSYTIPKSTPFALTGSATDANTSDVLTYCWEQNDNSTTTGASSVASPTKTTGPNWISFRPTSSPTRLFPQLATILAGGQVTGPLPGGDAGANIEALSSVARTLNFRLTVRDNAPYRTTSPVSVGQTNFQDVAITVSSASGPFAVSAPNTAVSWAAGSSQTVTWAVASTTATPVSCANVKISLSTDGGQTFPTVLAANTPNDGTELLNIPNTTTTTARIKVEAVGNIFFDISNSNFSITSATSCGAPGGLSSSSITASGATVSWTAVSGAVSYTVDYKRSADTAWTNAAAATTATSVNLSGLAASTVHDWRVRTNCSGSASGYSASQFTTTGGTTTCGTVTGLASSSITSNSATVSWSAVSGAVSYDVDYKTSAATTWTNAVTATTATSRNLTGLAASTVYNWRVRANCSGSTGAYATANFTTASSTTTGCASPLDNTTNGSMSGAATIPFNTNVTGLISGSTDRDFYKFVITTGGTITITLGTLPKDYDVKLHNSAGTQLAVSQNGSTTGETINYNIAPGTYFIQVYGYNGVYSTTLCYTLKAQLGTASRFSFAELHPTVVKVSPNPATSIVNISVPALTEKSELQVMDSRGKTVIQKRMTNNNEQLDISKLSKGLYIIKSSDGKNTFTEKFVKQ